MKLVYWPAGILKCVSKTLTEPPEPELIAAMKSTMRAHHGAGLSAVQVGVLKRLVVVEGSSGPEVFVNPAIKEFRGDKVLMIEGCLSVPGFFEEINRAPEILVEYQNEKLEPAESWFNGQMAQVLQHELEHLDGKMYLDHLSTARRSTIMGNMQKLRKAGKLR